VAQPAWDGPYAKSTVLLMKEIAKHHRVLYVDYAATWKDFFASLFKGDFKKTLRLLGVSKRLKSNPTEVKQLAILTLPPILPINFLPNGKIYSVLSNINGWVASISIKKAMRKLNLQRPVVVNAFAPGLGVSLFNRLNELANFYYCYDEIGEADWNKKHGGKMEDIYSRKANAVILSSDALRQEKTLLNRKTFVVKNGVDFEKFQSVPKEIHKNHKPVVGFVGSLDSRIDYHLLHQVISASPEYDFVFVGRVVDRQFEGLREYSNVRWIHPVDYHDLPNKIQQFDIGIIPFVKSAFTEKIYPLKINEYLAVGKPVVMTSFASLPEFDHLVEKADDANSFKQKIAKSIQCNSLAMATERKAFAKNNSWKKRAEEFCIIIDQVMCSPHPI
jgi:glycosyltransferase involved in cell wall biosynthesis